MKKDDIVVQKWRCRVAAGRRRGRFPVGVMVRSQDGRRHHDNNALNKPDRRHHQNFFDDDVGDSFNPDEFHEQADH